MDYLRSLEADAPAQNAGEGDMAEELRDLFGVPSGAQMKVSLASAAQEAMRDVAAWRENLAAEDDDVETAATLAAFYERAAGAGATVICGIV